MKKVLLLFICLSAILSGYSQGWTLQQSNTDVVLKSVYFINPLTGWVVGGNGTILKTTDGGENWIAQSSGTINELSSVYFTDSLTGFAVSVRALLKTVDGGNTWFVQDTTQNRSLSRIFFIGKDTGFVAGDGTLLKTTDGGISWTKYGNTSGFSMNFFWATDAETFFLGGEYMILVRSTNGGTSWDLLYGPDSGVALEGIFFADKETGYLVGGATAWGNFYSLFRKTIDGGFTWTNPLEDISEWMTSVFFTDSQTGYISTAEGNIFKTTDGGNHCFKLVMPTTSYINAMCFPDSLIGYAVGFSGKILKTTSGGVGITGPTRVTGKIKLYPNPVTDLLMIEAEANEACQNMKYEIKVFDPAGRLLTCLSTTNNKVSLDFSSYNNGVFFIQITSMLGSETFKVVK